MTVEYELAFYTDDELIEELRRRHSDIIVIMASLKDGDRLEIKG